MLSKLKLTILLLILTPVSTAAYGQESYIKASDTNAEDLFGDAIAIDGDRMVVGASSKDGVIGVGEGAVYVFDRDSNGNWIQTSTLNSSTPQSVAFFGSSVAVSGDYILIGAPNEKLYDNSGFVTSIGIAHLFHINSSGHWIETDRFINGVDIYNSGYSESVSILEAGDFLILAIGSPNENGGTLFTNNAGAVHVWMKDLTNVWNSGNWESQSLHASNAQEGDHFGSSVSLTRSSGVTLVVGAPEQEDDSEASNNNSGATYVFTLESPISNWFEEAHLKPSTTYHRGFFGKSVAISDNTVVIGAPQAGVGLYPGEAYVFSRSGSTWAQQSILEASDKAALNNFGNAVAISGDKIVVGSHRQGINDIDNQTYMGAAYVFSRSGSNWNQTSYLTASNREAQDFFGHAVSISGELIAVSAWKEDGVDNLLSDSGAAYVYFDTDDNYEPNDTLETAYDLSSNERTWLNKIDGKGVQSNDDWYKIHTDNNSDNLSISLVFTHTDGDIDLRLYDDFGQFLDYSISVSDNEFINFNVSTNSDYYLKVSFNNAGNTYDLWWDDISPGTIPGDCTEGGGDIDINDVVCTISQVSSSPPTVSGGANCDANAAIDMDDVICALNKVLE